MERSIRETFSIATKRDNVDYKERGDHRDGRERERGDHRDGRKREGIIEMGEREDRVIEMGQRVGVIEM